MLICPYCESPIDLIGTFCPNCGRELETELIEKSKIYYRALERFRLCYTENDFLTLKAEFEKVKGFKSAESLIEQCAEKALDVKRKKNYGEAADILLEKYESIKKYEKIIALLEPISGWKDSDEIIEKCKNKIELIKKRQEEAEAAEKALREHDLKTLKKAVPICIGLLLIMFIAFKFVIPSFTYNAAVEYMNSGDYESAYHKFRSVDTYKDSSEKRKECGYYYAIELINEGKYEEAVSVFLTLGDYKDSEEYVNHAKYEYVKKNITSPDTNTFYTYIKSLKNSNYKDSEKLFNELYKWKVKIYANTSENGTSSMSSISRYNTVYFHIELSGGEPNGSTRLTYKIVDTDGDVSKKEWDFAMSDGTTTWCSSWYSYPQFAKTGNKTIYVYEKNGSLLGKHTIRIS